LEDKGVPRYVYDTWVAALRGEKWRHPVPATVGPITLDPYQVDAVKNLSSAGGILALACGLGKTAIATAAALSCGGNLCLIACPLNAMGTWRRMIPLLQTRFTEVMVQSIDSLHKLRGLGPTNSVVIFDEAHLLGDTTARRTKQAHEVRLRFEVGLCLTGTLLHGGIHKALSIQDLAIPGAAGFSSQWKAGEYFRCIVRKQLGTRSVTSLERPAGLAKERVQEYLSRYTQSLTYTSPAVAIDVEQEVKTIKMGQPWYCNWDWTRNDQCGEDTFFMRRLNTLGVPIVVDPDLHSVHWSHHGPIPVVPDQPEMAYCV
jgi:hypothetical protein